MINYTAADTTDETQELLTDEELQIIKHKSVAGAVSFFGRTLFLNVLGIVAALILSAYFTPDDFGIYGFVTQIIGLLIFFSDIGLAASLVQQKAEPTLEQYRAAFTIQQILAWIIVILSVAVIATGIVEDKTGITGVFILVSLALSFPITSFKTISSIILERKLEFSKVVIPQIVENVVFYGVLIFMAIRGMGAIAYAYAILARSILGLVTMWIIQPWAIGVSLNKSVVRGLIGYGSKFQLNDFLARVKDSLFFLVVGWFLPLNQFGLISWAKNWSMYPYNLTVQNVMAITFPTFSRLQGHPEALKKAIEKGLFFITLLIFPILVGMCLFIQPVTEVIPKYTQWQPAILSFILFTLGVGWSALSTPLTNTLNAIGKINQSLKLMVMWTVLTWVITPIMMYFFGFNGVAIAAFLIALTSVIPIFMVKRIVPIVVWDQVWRQLLAAGVMVIVGLVGWQFWSRGIGHLVGGMAAVGASYVLALLIIGRQKIMVELGSLLAVRRAR